MCISGQYYIIGNVGTYVESYLVERGDYPAQDTWFISVLVTCVFACGQLGTVCGGVLDRAIGSHLTALLGLSLTTVGTALTCWTIRVSTIAVLITFGAISSLGFGCAYGCPYSAINKHNFKNLGLIYGIVNSGFGGGAVVFNFVISAFINPDNLAPDKRYVGRTHFSQSSVLDRTPYCFLLLSAMYAAFLPVAVWGMRPPPPPPPFPTPTHTPAPALTPSAATETALDDTVLHHGENAEHSNGQKDQFKGQQTTISGTDKFQLKGHQTTISGTEKLQLKGQHNSAFSTEKSQLKGSHNSASNGSQSHATYQAMRPQEVTLEGRNTLDEEEREGFGREGGRGGEEGGGEPEGLAPRQLFCCRTYYILWLVLFLSGMANNAVVGHYKELGQTHIRNDILLASMGTVGSLLSAISRPMWGFLIDVISFKTVVILQCGVTAIFLVFWRVVLLQCQWLYYLFTVILFTVVSAVAVMLVVASKGYFGQKHLVANLALLWTPITMESILLPVVTSVGLANYGWDGLLLILALEAVIGMLVAMLLPRDLEVISYVKKSDDVTVRCTPSLNGKN